MAQRRRPGLGRRKITGKVKDMYKILAIGNSFSGDATYFLHDILESAGVENKVVNLYIGGCPLERHWQNIEQNAAAYQYQRNGRPTDRWCSIEEVLAEEAFDAIVTHQASGDSGWENTYEPFLGLLLDFLKEKTQAKLFLNETWAYETGSEHPHFMRYRRSQEEMLSKLRAAYQKEAAKYRLPLIETGEVVQKLRALPFFQEGGRKVTRDGYHLNFLYGRYAAALSWAKMLGGIDVLANPFVPEVNFLPFEKADPQVIGQIKKIVDETVGNG